MTPVARAAPRPSSATGPQAAQRAERIQVGYGNVCALSRGDVTCRDLCTGKTQVAVHDAVDVSYIGRNACAVKRSGEVVCWWPFLGGPKVATARQPALRVYAGLGDACALLQDGAMKCWRHGPGEAPWSGANHCPFDNKHVFCTPSDPLGNKWTSAGLGWFGACFVAADGSVSCAGPNDVGQAAPVAARWLPDATPVQLPAPAKHVVMTGSFSCALLRDGRVLCWGDASHQQWAGGALGKRSPPSVVRLPGPARALLTAGLGACAVVGNDVYCWGGFVLPSGSQAESPTHVLGGVRTLAVGLATACASLVNGKLFCWGAYQRQCPGHPPHPRTRSFPVE